MDLALYGGTHSDQLCIDKGLFAAYVEKFLEDNNTEKAYDDDNEDQFQEMKEKISVRVHRKVTGAKIGRPRFI
ncbi:MAG: hypothetical protein KAR05_06720 [Candidatus Omnitrophica bacterium]|nr:hypothetical protein [Candidatus Omnitrophota bacterium]